MTRLRPLHYAGFALLALLGLLALVLYQRAALLVTETQIIETYAAEYLAEAGEGAALTDCRAVPGVARSTRMIVICGPALFDPTKHYEYHVGPLGGLIEKHGPGDWGSRDPVAGREAA